MQRHSAGPVQKHSAARAQAGSHVIVYFVFVDFFSSHVDLHAGSHGGLAAWFVQFVQRGPSQVQSAAMEAVRYVASPRVARSVKQGRRIQKLHCRIGVRTMSKAQKSNASRVPKPLMKPLPL
jgi:hypothetical protein